MNQIERRHFIGNSYLSNRSDLGMISKGRFTQVNLPIPARPLQRLTPLPNLPFDRSTMRTFSPKLALCNFIDDSKALKELALDCGFQGVDWTFNYQNLPQNLREERELVRKIAGLYPLEVRYHCFFPNMDIGAVYDEESVLAMNRFRSVCKLVQKLRGRTITIHVGLGRESTSDLSWDKTLEALADLTVFASRSGLRLCVENLVRGWTSRPVLYEKIMRKSLLWGTLDIGHAQVCTLVKTRVHDVEDFVEPHRERFLNAHVYHEETMEGHVPPRTAADIAHRLRLLLSLPSCDWWVLELREEQALMKTLRVVRSFLADDAAALAHGHRDDPLRYQSPQKHLQTCMPPFLTDAGSSAASSDCWGCPHMAYGDPAELRS